MGIDVHALNFLRYAVLNQRFGDTITLGRQGVYLPDTVSQAFVNTEGPGTAPVYCETLLQSHFGATRVDSIDHSRYEGATHLHDLNHPIPADLIAQYDTVFDGGCLEHIFNVPQALRNCSSLLKPGGQLIHVLPANNFCGHGFWQFSPELFFSLYCEGNGYSGTEVFIADLGNTEVWYRVRRPEAGRRVNIESTGPLYVLVLTRLHHRTTDQAPVQQSDYVHEWHVVSKTDDAQSERTPHPPAAVCATETGALSAVNRLPDPPSRCRQWLWPFKATPSVNPDLTRIELASLRLPGG